MFCDEKIFLEKRVFLRNIYHTTTTFNSHLNCSAKEVFWAVSKNSQVKRPVLTSLYFIKVLGCILYLQLYLKETPAQVFSLKFCDIFQSCFLINIWKWLHFLKFTEIDFDKQNQTFLCYNMLPRRKVRYVVTETIFWQFWCVLTLLLISS